VLALTCDLVIRARTLAAHSGAEQSGETVLQERHEPFAASAPFVRETVGMVEYAVEYGYYAPERDLTWSRKIDPPALTWEQFLKRSNWQGEPLTFGTVSDRDHAAQLARSETL
jgi:hypothetical protein